MKKLMVCLIVLSGVATFAGEITWRGGGSTSAWSDGSNWDGGNAPGANDTAVIPSGKHAYMSSADVETASAAPLAGISLAAADSELFITNNSAVTLSVPLSGVGQLKISNEMKTLTLAADNGNLSGPVTITNSSVCSDYSHGNFLGRNNVITNYMGDGKSGIYFFKSGDYYNDWYVIGDSDTSVEAAGHAVVSYASVTFHGKFCVNGSFHVNTPQAANKVKFVGGVEHEGYDRLTLYGNGNYEISGDEPVVSRTTRIYESGINLPSKLLLSSPVKNDGWRVSGDAYVVAVYSRIGGGGLITCGAKNVFNGGIGLQQGELTPGTTSARGMRLNLNGYDQACGTMYRSSGVVPTPDKCFVTSSVPATLTMRGQWEYYGNDPSSTDKTRLAFLDQASFEFWPTNYIRGGGDIRIKPKIWFTNTTWTTRGELACRRGTLTIDADVEMPKLSRLTVSHEGRLVVRDGATINPDKFMLAITNVQSSTTASAYSVPLTIESGVQLKADRAFVGDRWLDRGTYGGQEALDAGLIDASHVLPELGGSGVLSVKRYGIAGFMMIVM